MLASVRQTPTRLFLKQYASHAESVAVQQTERAAQAEQFAQNVQEQSDVRIHEVVFNARKLLEEDRGRTKETNDFAVKEVNRQCQATATASAAFSLPRSVVASAVVGEVHHWLFFLGVWTIRQHL